MLNDNAIGTGHELSSFTEKILHSSMCDPGCETAPPADLYLVQVEARTCAVTSFVLPHEVNPIESEAQ